MPIVISTHRHHPLICSQVLKLLQKFLESGVIEDAKGKDRRAFEDGSRLYRFVTSPNPLNFIEEEEEEEVDEKDSSVLCIANSYALIGGGIVKWSSINLFFHPSIHP